MEDGVVLVEVIEMMTELHDQMVSIYGRADTDMRAINKMIRDLIVI